MTGTPAEKGGATLSPGLSGVNESKAFAAWLGGRLRKIGFCDRER
jgi:hypothetical protein